MVLDREVRRAGEKGTKRSRSHSTSEETKKDKKKKKKVEIAQIQEVVNVEKPDEAMEMEDNTDTSIVEKSEVKPEKEKKKKSKKKKRDAEKETKADGVEVETETTTTLTEEPEKLIKQKKQKSEKSEEASTTPAQPTPIPMRDPGWDFTATSVSAPAWQAASIWSDDELDDEKENDSMEAKSHVSKAEAKRRKRVEEELAASREQRLLDGEVAQPTTLEEFERLVVASPDSSLVWVQYMALAMQGGELEVARGVAKRALQRINFRLEDE